MPGRTLFALLALGLSNLAAQSFVATGSMIEARYLHSAALLADGRVVVIGGYTSLEPSKTAEIFDPAIGTWHYTQHTLNVARVASSMVRLPDGKILIVGGIDDSNTITGAVEIFDPVTETFVLTSPMLAIRGPNIAFLLANGSVLVIRAATGEPDAFGVESFDPETKQWTARTLPPTGALIPAGALLPDGRVLIAGGAGNGTYAAVYNPTGDIWQSMAPLLDGRRWDDKATLLPNGKILITSGIFAVPFETLGTPTTELYDASVLPLGQSVFGPDLFSGIQGNSPGGNGHAATLLSEGNVLLSGGAYSRNYNFPASPVSGALLYDWMSLANSKIER